MFGSISTVSSAPADALAEADGEALADDDADALAETLADGDADPDALADGEAEVLAEAEADAEADGEALPDAELDGDALDDAEDDGDASSPSSGPSLAVATASVFQSFSPVTVATGRPSVHASTSSAKPKTSVTSASFSPVTVIVTSELTKSMTPGSVWINVALGAEAEADTTVSGAQIVMKPAPTSAAIRPSVARAALAILRMFTLSSAIHSRLVTVGTRPYLTHPTGRSHQNYKVTFS